MAGGAVSGPTSDSLGGQGIRVFNGFSEPIPLIARIEGRNLSRVVRVDFLGAYSPVAFGPANIKSDRVIEISIPDGCVGMNGTATVNVRVDDDINAPVQAPVGWTYQANQPIQLYAPFGVVPVNGVAYIVGPCENLSVVPDRFPDGSLHAFSCTNLNVSCVKILDGHYQTRQNAIPRPLFPNANIALFTWDQDCQDCSGGTGSYTGYFSVVATNDKLQSRTTTACLSTVCTGH